MLLNIVNFSYRVLNIMVPKEQNILELDLNSIQVFNEKIVQILNKLFMLFIAHYSY